MQISPRSGRPAERPRHCSRWHCAANRPPSARSPPQRARARPAVAGGRPCGRPVRACTAQHPVRSDPLRLAARVDAEFLDARLLSTVRVVAVAGRTIDAERRLRCSFCAAAWRPAPVRMSLLRRARRPVLHADTRPRRSAEGRRNLRHLPRLHEGGRIRVRRCHFRCWRSPISSRWISISQPCSAGAPGRRSRSSAAAASRPRVGVSRRPPRDACPTPARCPCAGCCRARPS